MSCGRTVSHFGVVLVQLNTEKVHFYGFVVLFYFGGVLKSGSAGLAQVQPSTLLKAAAEESGSTSAKVLNPTCCHSNPVYLAAVPHLWDSPAGVLCLNFTLLPVS